MRARWTAPSPAIGPSGRPTGGPGDAGARWPWRGQRPRQRRRGGGGVEERKLAAADSPTAGVVMHCQDSHDRMTFNCIMQFPYSGLLTFLFDWAYMYIVTTSCVGRCALAPFSLWVNPMN